MPIENPLLFYPRRVWEVVRGHVGIAAMLLKFAAVRRRIKADPKAFDYTDIALTPVTDHEQDELELLASK